jgi:hypothetical protein
MRRYSESWVRPKVYKHIDFATVQTLGKLKYLNDKYFKRDAFDYINDGNVCYTEIPSKS